jgi:putative transposase
MDSHLSDCREQGLPNRRNGKQTKTVKSGVGSFELETPRDRENSYEPEIIKKRQTVFRVSAAVIGIFVVYSLAKATLLYVSTKVC